MVQKIGEVGSSPSRTRPASSAPAASPPSAAGMPSLKIPVDCEIADQIPRQAPRLLDLLAPLSDARKQIRKAS
jgi:hypothetical protein